MFHVPGPKKCLVFISRYPHSDPLACVITLCRASFKVFLNLLFVTSSVMHGECVNRLKACCKCLEKCWQKIHAWVTSMYWFVIKEFQKDQTKNKFGAACVRGAGVYFQARARAPYNSRGVCYNGKDTECVIIVNKIEQEKKWIEAHVNKLTLSCLERDDGFAFCCQTHETIFFSHFACNFFRHLKTQKQLNKRENSACPMEWVSLFMVPDSLAEKRANKPRAKSVTYLSAIGFSF